MAQYANPIPGYTDEAAPSGWTERWTPDTMTPSVVADATRDGRYIFLDKTGSDGRYMISWDTPGSVADVEVLAKLRFVANVDDGGRVYLRGGATLKYMAYLRPTATNTVRVGWYNGNTFTQLGTIALTMSAGNWYWVRFRAVGTAIKCKAWADGSAEPGAWGLEVTDTHVPDAAYCGIGGYAQDVLCSYFSVGTAGDSAPDPVAISPLASATDIYVDTAAGAAGNAGTSWGAAMDSLRHALMKVPVALDSPCTIHCKGADTIPVQLVDHGHTQAYQLTIQADEGDSYSLAAGVVDAGVILHNAPWAVIDNIEVENTAGTPVTNSSAIQFLGTAAGDERTFQTLLNTICHGGRYAIRNDGNRSQYLRNCLAYGDTYGAIGQVSPGVSTKAIMWLDNCTAIGVTYGIAEGGSGGIKARNCYASGATAYTAMMDKVNCASSDTTGSAGLQNIALDTDNFTDPDNDDYSIVEGSALESVGLKLSDEQSRAYVNVSSVVPIWQARKCGIVLTLTNGSAVATVQFRDFGAAAWLESRTFNLGFAFSGSTIKIAILSDIHMGTGEVTTEQADFEGALDDLDAMGDIGAIFVLGDIADSGLEAQYDTYLTSKATSAVSTWKELAGNHDDSAYFESKLSYTDRYYSYTVGNVVFIFLGDEDGIGGISEDAQTFLDDTLSANQDKNCIILSHEGRYLRNEYSYLDETHLDPAAAISSIVDSYDWQAWIYGHVHGYDNGLYRCQKAGPFSVWQSYTEAKDIVGTARSGSWDIGAYQIYDAPPAGGYMLDRGPLRGVMRGIARGMF